jgi:hypothetical protein
MASIHITRQLVVLTTAALLLSISSAAFAVPLEADSAVSEVGGTEWSVAGGGDAPNTAEREDGNYARSAVSGPTSGGNFQTLTTDANREWTANGLAPVDGGDHASAQRELVIVDSATPDYQALLDDLTSTSFAARGQSFGRAALLCPSPRQRAQRSPMAMLSDDNATPGDPSADSISTIATRYSPAPAQIEGQLKP